MGDAAVTQAIEVLGGDLRAHDVVRPDEGIEAIVAEAVDEHVGDTLLAQPANGWVAQKGAGQDDAVHSPRREARQVRALPVGAAVRIAEHDVVAAWRGAVFDSAKEGGEERIRHVRDDDRQGERLLQLEAAGDPVRAVFGLAEQRLDPAAGRRGDAQAGIVIGHPGDGRGMDADPIGELLQRDGHRWK